MSREGQGTQLALALSEPRGEGTGAVQFLGFEDPGCQASRGVE